MTAKHWEVVRALCTCVRVLAIDDQLKRLTGIADDANMRRFLRPLVVAELVRVVNVLAKPVPVMEEPLLTWPVNAPCGCEKVMVADGVWYAEDSVSHHANVAATIWIGRVLYRASRRWADLSARPIRCAIATRKAGKLYGVKRSELPTKPLQASHDLAVAGVYVTKKTQGKLVQAEWIGEDADVFKLGEKVPDVRLRPFKDGCEQIVEIVGSNYTHDKLLAIHRECNARGLAYELW